jgi:hypothetical protein
MLDTGMTTRCVIILIIKYRGEYVSFSEHQKTLRRHLDELGLRERTINSVEPDPDGQFVAIADQLSLVYDKGIHIIE